jgi:hypothetical protein
VSFLRVGGGYCGWISPEGLRKTGLRRGQSVERLETDEELGVVVEEVEISSLDLRYESHRMKSKAAEKALLASIAEGGIRDPLQGVNANDERILLDGFKRCRCAKRLGIGLAPYHSLGSDEASGILELLRISNARSLSILEQAKLIDELGSVHNMSNREIAGVLERSTAWVSVRTGIVREMSACVLQKIFAGEFPTYCYLYTLRRFMRINGIAKEEIDEFVRAVSGKQVSVRDIELLAHGYFMGSEDFRRQVRSGNISWGLSRMKETSLGVSSCTEVEKRMLKNLEILRKYMQRVMAGSGDTRFKTSSFYSQADLLAGGIVGELEGFSTAMREFHDRSGQAQRHLVSS